jgi:adenosine deaminase
MHNIDFRELPKVALHDHLDGGLRPETLLELANVAGVSLPAESPSLLGKAIAERANSGTLTGYLETFGWTVAVMQTAESLTRIACEAVEDLAADGVVLAELRFAPLLHTGGGLTPRQAIEAVTKGLAEGTRRTGLPAGLILCALRHRDEAQVIVDLFERSRIENELVIGIDLAGPEEGFPVEAHPAIAQLAKRCPGAPITIHAGEAAGSSSIWSAVLAGARRIGHGTRLIDDIRGDRALLRALRAKGILLEVCVSSNCQTGAVRSWSDHPLSAFLNEGVKVSIDADNRLISATSHSEEARIAHSTFGLTKLQLLQVARGSAISSFMPAAARRRALARIEAANVSTKA